MSSLNIESKGAVVVRGMDELVKKLDAAASVSVEETLNALGVQMKAVMGALIGDHETLKDAQEIRVQTWENGGYVALRPKGAGYRIKGKRYRRTTKSGRKRSDSIDGIKAWDLTKFTNDGHAIRRPLKLSKDYRPRIKVDYVLGKGYYDRTRKWAQIYGVKALEQLADKVEKALR